MFGQHITQLKARVNQRLCTKENTRLRVRAKAGVLENELWQMQNFDFLKSSVNTASLTSRNY